MAAAPGELLKHNINNNDVRLVHANGMQQRVAVAAIWCEDEVQFMAVECLRPSASARMFLVWYVDVSHASTQHCRRLQAACDLVASVARLHACTVSRRRVARICKRTFSHGRTKLGMQWSVSTCTTILDRSCECVKNNDNNV
eukprot:364669-Chlamydomonas_euryale.AAC.10